MLVAKNHTCNACGGIQAYAPQHHSLTCLFCATQVTVPEGKVVQENDYLATLAEDKPEIPSQKEEIKCDKCAGVFAFESSQFASLCPYCDTPALIPPSHALEPDGILPFIITRKEASAMFKKWVSSRWFAPTKFTKYFSSKQILKGTYLPHWTYDSNTTTEYQGERGDAYYVWVTKTVTEEGRRVQKEVQERRIDWSYTSGVVQVDFDDVIVPASPRVSKSILNALEPWETQLAQSFDSQYIAGFEAEEYSTSLEKGFTLAKNKMSRVIRRGIEEDIGGDEQRISSQNTQYHAITYKNILLPIWTAFFKWQDKEYQYAINGQTGELIGERPYSKTKIFFTILGLNFVVVGIAYFEELKMWFLGV